MASRQGMGREVVALHQAVNTERPETMTPLLRLTTAAALFLLSLAPAARAQQPAMPSGMSHDEHMAQKEHPTGVSPGRSLRASLRQRRRVGEEFRRPRARRMADARPRHRRAAAEIRAGRRRHRCRDGLLHRRLAKSPAAPKVYAVDIEPSMVEHVKQSAMREGLKNVVGRAGRRRQDQSAGTGGPRAHR